MPDLRHLGIRICPVSSGNGAGEAIAVEKMLLDANRSHGDEHYVLSDARRSSSNFDILDMR